MRQRIVFLAFLVFGCLWYQSHGQDYIWLNINLAFINHQGQVFRQLVKNISTRLVTRNKALHSYKLEGEEINFYTLKVKSCRSLSNPSPYGSADRYLKGEYQLLLEHIMPIENFALKIEDREHSFLEYLQLLSSLNSSSKITFDFTCVLLESQRPTHPDKSKDADSNLLFKTHFIGMIIFIVIIALVFGFCTIWMGRIHYYRWLQHRAKERLRKAHEKYTREMLAKSPVILFDPIEIDDETAACAICLEEFKPKEKLRKLVCSHYFHLTCIEPWLLSHQNCPLCNRNFLSNSIPSISASIMARRNAEDTTSVLAQENQVQ